MAGDSSPDVKLGSVIYGRVSGYPWWPGVISKCPRTHLWMKDGKFWVFFFNDTSGAWLKISEIRAFDPYNRDLCFEYNSTITKFRRYQERIDKAVSIAEAHINNSSRRLRIKLLPPRNSRPDDSSSERLRGADVSKNGHADLRSSHGRHIKQPVAKRPRKVRGLDPTINPFPVSSVKHSSDDDVPEVESTATAEATRPKRKRVRSTRYVDYIGPLRDKATEDKQPHSLADVVRNDQPRRQDKSSSASGKALRRSRRVHPASLVNHANGHTERSNRPPRASQSGNISDPVLEPERSRLLCTTVDLETSEDSFGLDELSRKKPWKDLPVHPANEGKRVRSSEAKPRTETPVTKELYINELTHMAGKSRRNKSFSPENPRRGVRSRVGPRSNFTEEGSGDCTDSEERPERERKLNIGSLEGAAEDLMEYAIRGNKRVKDRSESSGREKGNPDVSSLALGGADLVTSILNRISCLERDVIQLKERATCEDQATLGEDATAAGVKSAVEALAAASTAFAKARQYDTMAIRRSLQLLWPDGQFPLVGADGELLRTVAQSLILASCKRRQGKVDGSVQKNERSLQGVPEGVHAAGAEKGSQDGRGSVPISEEAAVSAPLANADGQAVRGNCSAREDSQNEKVFNGGKEQSVGTGTSQ